MQLIADRAGVSRMAVSLALRGSRKVSAKTAARIRQIAEELGYRPNPLVSALMTQLRLARPSQRPTTIAFVTAFPAKDGWRRLPSFAQSFEGARQRAEALGYQFEEWWLRDPATPQQRIEDILLTRDIHGLLIAPLPPGGAAVQFSWPKFSGATIGYSFGEAALHRASSDEYGSVMLALRELAQLGYRRPGLAIPREEDERVERRYSAAMLAYQAGLPADLRVPSLLAEGALAAPLVDWYREHEPDVVLSLSSDVPRVLGEIGARVPKEVGFVNLALTPGETDVAGVDQNFALVGAAAIDLVDAQLRRNELGAPSDRRTVVISGKWVAGGTVREVNGRKRKT